jgi:hypothetical protein
MLSNMKTPPQQVRSSISTSAFKVPMQQMKRNGSLELNRPLEQLNP